MSEEKPEPKKQKLRGLASLMNNTIISVKDTEECKYLIKGQRTRVLFNPKDGKWAALITIKDDVITVEGIRNTNKKDLSRKKLFWWGYFEATLADMMNASTWKTGKWLRKMAGGKVKGASQIALVGQVLALARSEQPSPTPTEKEE